MDNNVLVFVNYLLYLNIDIELDFYVYINEYFDIFFDIELNELYNNSSLMCSIAGHPNKNVVWKMLQRMKYRSPDGIEVIDDGKYAIGMGRLAIIDLESDGLFPFRDENLVVSFNGEIFNYIELREELIELGHYFRTESDTEVVAKAYLEWGSDCVHKFNGMFAIAIHDGAGVFLARDIAGEKPLYYIRSPFSFSSENKSLDFKGEEFPPGHHGYYKFSSGYLFIRNWWEPEEMHFENYEEALDYLDETLGDAVRIRTRADVPIGLYLSGGVDSTLISTYHDFGSTYTYEDGDYKDEFKSVFPIILWHLDAPVSSFSPFGLWKLAEEASKEVKVILSGEGADELFGGYVRYIPWWQNYQARKKYPSYGKYFPEEPFPGEEEFNGNLRELLRMEDRITSAWGMENRSPFLDKRIINFAYSIPPEWKFKGLEGKRILRDLLKRRKPDYEFEEKHGLYCSVNKWIGEEDPFSKETYHQYQKRLWRQVSSTHTGHRTPPVLK